MLNLSEFSYNHHTTGVKKLIKFIRRGFPVLNDYPWRSHKSIL